MNNLDISINTVYRYIKIRILVITIGLIITTVILPFWFPIIPNFEPTYSVYNHGDYGYSNVFSGLDTYQIDRSHTANSELYAEADLLILITPQRDLQTSYINQILTHYHSGMKLLLIGKENLNPLLVQFGIAISSGSTKENRIFDPVNNGGSKVFPKLANTFGIDDVYGVVPTDINRINPYSTSFMTTYNSSGKAYCYDLSDPCLSSSVVGVNNTNFMFVADSWMFNNQYSTTFPANKILFQHMINSLIGSSGHILVDESFLKWAPVNSNGVENFIDMKLNANLIATVIGIVAMLIPLIIGFQAKLFTGKEEDRDRVESSKSLESRLDYIHVEKLPAAPLNIQENIMMREKLQYARRGKYYFQYSANTLLDMIDSLKIEMPEAVMMTLTSLTKGVYDEFSSWRVLENAYDIIISQLSARRD